VRNVGIAPALAVTVLHQLEFAVFATTYFLSQVPLLLAAAVVFRWGWVTDKNLKDGADPS
jgi:hypothetical protein